MSNHENYRDEQFWFTTAIVAFNLAMLAKSPMWATTIASTLISLLGSHIVLTRWLADGKVGPDNPPNVTAQPRPSARERWQYTGREIRTYISWFRYIVAEFSGSLFYLLAIWITFVGVVWRFVSHLSVSCHH